MIKRRDGEKGRFYEINGKFLPSSTTILSAFPLEYGLKKFFQDHSEAEALNLLETAGNAGSKVHNAIQLILMGETISPNGITKEQLYKIGLVDDELIDYFKKPFNKKEDSSLRGFLNWVKEFDPIPLFLEKTVYDEKLGYAGTLDFVGTIKMKDPETKEVKRQLVIIDWKTGKGLYKSHELQLASYWYAMRTARPVTPYTRCFLVQLGINKCGYKHFEVTDKKKNFDNFMHVKALWDMLNPNAEPKNYVFLDKYEVDSKNLIKNNKK